MLTLKKITWRIVFCVTFIILLFNQKAFAELKSMDYTKAVIHHSASPDVSAKVIDQWHKQRGFDGIGYHFVIRQSGAIEKGRVLNKIGAHAKGRNHYIGICLTGYDTFTTAQIKSLITLLNDLKITYIERHHELCPGKGLNLDYIRARLKTPKIQYGKASYYIDKITANGEKFNPKGYTCALKKGVTTYGKKFRVTNTANGKTVTVRQNDCGTLKPGRIIDLTPAAFKAIAGLRQGIANVKVEPLN